MNGARRGSRTGRPCAPTQATSTLARTSNVASRSTSWLRRIDAPPSPLSRVSTTSSSSSRAGAMIFDLAAAHDESRAAALARFLMLDAVEPHHLGARALDEFEVIRVIDDAGRVGVLVIDAHREAMRLALQRALTWKIGARQLARCRRARSCAALLVASPSRSSCAAGGRSALRPRCA